MRAQAATNHIRLHPSEPLTRAALWNEMKNPNLRIPGIGNTDGQGYVRFDLAAGGYDGYPACNFENEEMSSWNKIVRNIGVISLFDALNAH